MKRLLLALLALAAASALSGCERLCSPNAAGKLVGAFCPDSPDNPLNDRPSAEFALSYPPARTRSPNGCRGRTRSRSTGT